MLLKCRAKFILFLFYIFHVDFQLHNISSHFYINSYFHLQTRRYLSNLYLYLYQQIPFNTVLPTFMEQGPYFSVGGYTFLIYQKRIEKSHTSEPWVEATLPPHYDGGKVRDVDDSSVQECGMGGNNQYRGLGSCCLSPPGGDLHTPRPVCSTAELANPQLYVSTTHECEQKEIKIDAQCFYSIKSIGTHVKQTNKKTTLSIIF